MARGTIKNLVSDRGFGFIQPDDTPNADKDLFFHQTDVTGTTYGELRTGQKVDFDIGRDQRRGTPKATNVRPTDAN